MAKQIIIYKCEECPLARFDNQELTEYRGKWVCVAEATCPEAYMLLANSDVTHGPPPTLCPLQDYQ